MCKIVVGISWFSFSSLPQHCASWQFALGNYWGRTEAQNTMRSVIFLLSFSCCMIEAVVASVSSSSELWSAAAAVVKADKEGSDWASTIEERKSKTQDAYVSASPLSVAAVCSDGVAMVSLHFGLESDNESQKGGNELFEVYNDLPLSSRGPLRIEPIYDNGAATNSITSTCSPPVMALLTAGWRADGIALSDAARELMMEETSLYCLPMSVTMGTNNCNAATPNGRPTHYGRRIADGLSYYMAKCAFSEGVRSLSTVGLLACNKAGGNLYLVDATGSYDVRAHAIGNGASVINKRLVIVDFEAMTCLEGLRMLLHITAEEGNLLSISTEDNSSKLGVPHCAVELALLRSGEQRVRRIRLSSLFTAADNPSEEIGRLIDE